MARVPLECENSGVSYLKLGPGFRSTYGHTHNVQEEIFVLVAGSGRMKLDDDIVELTPWTAVRVAPTTMRALEAGPGRRGADRDRRAEHRPRRRQQHGRLVAGLTCFARALPRHR